MDAVGVESTQALLVLKAEREGNGFFLTTPCVTPPLLFWDGFKRKGVGGNDRT